MNTLYLSILRISIIRFFRNPATYVLFILFFPWLLSFLGLCVFARSPVISVYITCFFLFYFNSIFWGAWIEGKKDPFTGAVTEKKIKDRFCVPFMSCLPIDRKRLYAVQVLFYIMLSAAICIISVMMQIIFPQARSHLNLVIYMHFLMFTLLIMYGGLYTVLLVPLLFRGEVKFLKDPAVILCFSFMFTSALICAVIYTKEAIGRLIRSENIFYMIDHPIVLLVPLAAGILMLWLGSIIFKSIDIRC